jgi:hypothetical protein
LRDTKMPPSNITSIERRHSSSGASIASDEDDTPAEFTMAWSRPHLSDSSLPKAATSAGLL